jgi:putative glutamine amidotransferase
MKALSSILLIFSLILSLPTMAALRLFEVRSADLLAPLVIPARESETPEKALERYFKSLEKNPELMELFAGQRPTFLVDEFRDITAVATADKVLLMANLPKDYTLNSLRVENFMKSFKRNGHESVILPIVANGGLSVSETQELFKMINDKFSFLVAMGGDDVDPVQYKKPNLHSRNVIPPRDEFEVQLIKSYTRAEKGFLLGICRGSQISAVALGYELNQHVPFHIGTELPHGNDWHDIKTFSTNHNILNTLALQDGRLHVNSLHHQSVIYKENGPLQIAARSSDGVVEALEFKNGRGILMQFHPELMGNALGDQILSQVIQQKNKVQSVSTCRRVLF